VIVAMTVELAERGNWLITVERGNADHVQTLKLTDMEARQLAALLDIRGPVSVTFEDVTA
jgi:ABC-type antimicrobial peptide transport system ATPase subunit